MRIGAMLNPFGGKPVHDRKESAEKSLMDRCEIPSGFHGDIDKPSIYISEMKTFFPVFLLISSISYPAIRVAITVDDLPTHGALPNGVIREEIATKMVKAFKKHRVPDVYAFINAGKVEQLGESFEVLRIWQAAGFPFGNHTYLHKDLDKVAISNFKADISQNEFMLRKLSSSENWRYFRYPFLHEGASLQKRNSIRRYIKSLGYTIAQVTIDFEDWSWNDPYARCKEKNDLASIALLEKSYLKNSSDILDRAEQLSRALFKRSISHVLLLHIGVCTANSQFPAL
jgi:peptidoglycan/xylan/chitin deacetylase (PgdA/CDA1 family)